MKMILLSVQGMDCFINKFKNRVFSVHNRYGTVCTLAVLAVFFWVHSHRFSQRTPFPSLPEPWELCVSHQMPLTLFLAYRNDRWMDGYIDK
jgi:hypothetical protein